MYPIVAKRKLAENVHEYVIAAPMVAKNAKAGQFIILRVDENGERVPFTVCDYDKEKGTVTILVQTVGYTTHKLAQKNAGDSLADFVGPLGNPTNLSGYNKVIAVAGGIGSAVIYPQAKLLQAADKPLDVILGARNESLILHREAFEQYAQNVFVATDNGSMGVKGFVTDVLKDLLQENSARYDAVFAVGPLPMMKAVCALTKEYGVKTVVSMYAVMVDGTGMCGCCRLTVGGKTQYACVHGPEFDGHLVDFNEAGNRLNMFKEAEAEHNCRIRRA
jgi:ferredoxin--NADP+ reductase